MNTPPIVSPKEWETARQQLLVKEKELTRARDALAAARRRMPWLRVEKDYRFDGPAGTQTLLGLFEGRRQLIVYRAFFEARMGWQMPWYTMTDDFDKDFGVDEWHGTNAFVRDGDQVFRTYFINNRGDEAMGSTWIYLDITALGRQEQWEESPEGYPQTPPYEWWFWHDEPRPTTQP
ncbi:MAG: DUF899 family protein [Acidimicrobiales bacterium]